jgi:hypothetical protein
VVVVIGGKRFFLWRAVDSEVLDLLVQRRWDKTAAVTFLPLLHRVRPKAAKRAAGKRRHELGDSGHPVILPPHLSALLRA